MALRSRFAQEVGAHRGFFPAAILCGLVVIPVWTSLYRDRPELSLWHGHEMLFGYGLAVVAGFLLARIRRDIFITLLATWLMARIAVPLGMPAIGSAAALAFATLLAGIGALRFLRAAKKGRNRIFALILIGMAVAEAVYQAGAFRLLDRGEQRGILLVLDLLTLLMLQMGGRVIPALTAGVFYRRGGFLASRVQPWVETAIGILMIGVLVADQVPWLEMLAGIAAILTAMFALFRLARWRPWTVFDVPDLVGLHIAYGWLVVGLALKGIAALTGALSSMAGFHALGIGAMGTLTLVMMARTAATRDGAGSNAPGSIVLVVALTGIAALARIIAAFDGLPLLIWGAAAGWTLAVLVFAILYARIAFSTRRNVHS